MSSVSIFDKYPKFFGEEIREWCDRIFPLYQKEKERENEFIPNYILESNKELKKHEKRKEEIKKQMREFTSGATRDSEDGKLDLGIELAWSAGFYDGEGSISCTTNNGNPFTRVQLSIGQKNDPNGQPAETLQRFLNAVGVGKIYRKTAKGKEKNQHQYTICKRKNVEIVLQLLWPYLSTQKRKQAQRAFRLLDSGIKDFNLSEREKNENF
ncbi:hypothetical protein LCGC14_1276570 [marine sediment metagenome]|uniref:Homing endonuclease LAGLIDADG domain-containing protein n=1 Tax=marine sediment metagenome TaxID=412755 RepID=A0A0F9ND19_9ZZZZ|nr:hypothetical protein [Candidatus Aminicenantes bacterium]